MIGGLSVPIKARVKSDSVFGPSRVEINLTTSAFFSKVLYLSQSPSNQSYVGDRKVPLMVLLVQFRLLFNNSRVVFFSTDRTLSRATPFLPRKANLLMSR